MFLKRCLYKGIFTNIPSYEGSRNQSSSEYQGQFKKAGQIQKIQFCMKRNSKSSRKLSPQKPVKKKQCTKKCMKKEISPLNVQNSLYRKYSNTQNFHYVNGIDNLLKDPDLIKLCLQEERQQCLQKYYRPLNRKHLFPKIKEVYKMHTDIPKISHPEVKKIVDKCYHRKRLLDYFKIAKVLGIKVSNYKFSTFFPSMNDNTNKKMQQQKNYVPIITKISTIDFSSEAERNLLQEFFIHERHEQLSHKQNWISAQNSQRCN